MKKFLGIPAFFALFFLTPFAIVIIGFFYISSQHVGLPTIDELRAKYPTCEQRSEFVSNYVKERQAEPIDLSMRYSPMEFIDRPATSLEDSWNRYRAGVEDILERQARRIFVDTLYDLGRGCWHDLTSLLILI
ncbi:hypothetical protein [Acaryochloris marina]|uniref:Uncharacterized protein n=1 Tax=Acaryochloris marina (strain MBIC 11017) TaxID=329726 RepID=A8ZPN5_ACAM1|nr:hypothetical protein [Acaryochloris marina]ABW32971.1 hypothetical protein AM1_E0202 [Acaryochloris marina MBIC11017]